MVFGKHSRDNGEMVFPYRHLEDLILAGSSSIFDFNIHSASAPGIALGM